MANRAFVWGLLAAAPFLAGVTCGGFLDEDVEERTLTAAMEGAQVVPPVETKGTGQATARLYGNTLAIQGTFADLPAPALGGKENAILFAIGDEGENGTPVYEAPVSSVDGRTGSFGFTILVTNELADEFLAGRTYVVLRTVAHPEGELRAQLR